MAKKIKARSLSDGASVEEVLEGSLLYDNLLIEPIIQEIDSSGLHNPQQYEDKPCFGKVIMVGTGRVFDSGIVTPIEVKVGEKVYFQQYSAQKIRVDGKDLLIVREEDIYWRSGKRK